MLSINRSVAGSFGTALSLVLALGTFTYTLAFCPVPMVDGYRQAAEFTARSAPENSVVLFSGYRDGSFIFNLRAQEDRSDLSVLRADKLLLKLTVRRDLGVEEMQYTEDEIAELLNRYGVHYAVAQSDFWTDLEQMARLQRVLRSDRFEEIARIQTEANHEHQDREIRIYRNLGAVAQGPIELKLEVGIIGRTLEGTIGDR